MRNKSEATPRRPARMHRREILQTLAALTAGSRFRVWYLERGFFTEKVIRGESIFLLAGVVLDEEDADAVRENRPMEFEMLSKPAHDTVGEATLLYNGKKSEFVYDYHGIHHIEILD